MKALLGFLLAISMFGCASTETATPGNTAAEKGATVAAAGMEKCGDCNAEFAKAELTSHDGKMVCKKCLDAHDH